MTVGFGSGDLDPGEEIRGVLQMRGAESLSAVVRGDDVAAAGDGDDGEHQRGSVGEAKMSVMICPCEPARGRPVAGLVSRPGDVHRVGEERAVGGHLVEIHGRLRVHRRIRPGDDPRLAAVAPGGAVILGDQQAEVRADEDPVRRVGGKWMLNSSGKAPFARAAPGALNASRRERRAPLLARRMWRPLRFMMRS